MKDKCDIMLMAMLGSQEMVDRWWKSPNHAFNRLTPLEVDIEDVYSYLLGMCAYV